MVVSIKDSQPVNKRVGDIPSGTVFGGFIHGTPRYSGPWLKYGKYDWGIIKLDDPDYFFDTLANPGLDGFIVHGYVEYDATLNLKVKGS